MNPGKENISVREKLDGFTILEVIFVILLTSIVMMLTFLFFDTFQRYLKQINETTGYETEVLRFESLMQYDFDRSQYIFQKSTGDNILECRCSGISYEFNDNNIIRYQNETEDTLHVEELYFEAGTYEKSDTLIETINLEFSDLHKRERRYSFYKKMSERVKFEQFRNSR